MKIDFKDISPERPVICWWSGGVTSAVACMVAINLFGKENVRIVFIDTRNEDEDTYRFKNDCEKWYGLQIETIADNKYESIQHVWRRHLSLNVSKGAECSLMLKRKVREKWQKTNKYSYQVFGFDISESKRALSMTLNNSDINPIYLLMLLGYSKRTCIDILAKENISVPRTYQLGFHNNNCFKTGCVQGGIGYWQKMQKEFPEKFDSMAEMEHELTNKKGKPVTMLKDQGKEGGLVFLKPHPDYLEIKDISMMKGREPKPLMECNGFCGINDLSERNETADEINFESDNQLKVI